MEFVQECPVLGGYETMNPFLILSIVCLAAAAFYGWTLYSISKVIKTQRRFDGHDHAKVLKVCPRQQLPSAVANGAGVGTLPSMANPGDEYAIVAFEPEPRVHIETTTSFGMPTGFFKGVETVEIQYDLNTPTHIYLCDERPILAKHKFFQIMAGVFLVFGLLGILLGL